MSFLAEDELELPIFPPQLVTLASLRDTALVDVIEVNP